MLRLSWIGGGGLGVRDPMMLDGLLYVALLPTYTRCLLLGVGTFLTWVWHSGQGVRGLYIDGSDHPGWKSRGVMVVCVLFSFFCFAFRVCQWQ